ncbi:RNA-guided endonuclease InsQ/TnpB family protein [Nonomuraea sp. NPDC049480]|uniref:RNA-guided endonuclease InsQ/TnpB family protein n=1 Tax=Nonomuraea sp. NPDC049480 TaxID=3364353 RepID=UPI0037AED0B8
MKTGPAASSQACRRPVARQHAKVTDARRDFLHQSTTRVIRENQTITLESLAVRALSRGPLAKSVHDAGWGTFIRMVEDKGARYGRAVTKVSRWFASTKTCPCCGWVNTELTLADREWDCRQCGEHHDRDVAAALNLLAEGIRLRTLSGADTGTGSEIGSEIGREQQVAAGLADTGNDCGGRVRPGEAIPTLAQSESYGAQAG